jgi:DHA1 family bicyclomycin/chloramphenicol resistance-like MFS transporter
MKQARFLAAVAVGLFAAQSASFMLAPLLVAIATEFDTSVAVTGQLATVTFAAWAVSVILVGPLSDSLGRRPVALAGLTLLSAGVLASAFSPNLETLMALRVLTGLGGGMIPPNSMAAVADSVSPAKRAQVVGALMAFSTLSSVIGVPLVALSADSGGWRVPFVAIGSLLAACALLNLLWFPKSAGAGLRSFSFISRYRNLLAMPVFRSALAVNLTQRMAYFALFSYLAAYLIDAYDMNVGAVALPLGFVGMGTVIGSYAGGIVANGKDRMPLAAVATLIGGAGTLLLFSTDAPLWATVAIATAAISLLSIGWPVVITLSTEVSGQSRATGIGILGVSNQSGGVGGAALGGILLASIGFPGVGYLCLGAAVFSTLIIVLFMRQADAGAKLLVDEPV